MNAEELRKKVAEKVLSHDYTEGPLLVLAGPGTGKTYSLIETIKRQIDNGLTIVDFYTATLTNSSARDFEEEVQNKIDTSFDQVSTLHYRAKGIVHKYADRVSLQKSFRILTDAETEVVLEDIRQDFNALGKQLAKREAKESLKDYRETVANLKAMESEFYKMYAAYQKFYNALGWFDVVTLACRILCENDDIRNAESATCSFILIDEYQDLNPADQEFIRLLCNGRSTFLVVGDDDQSIYSGRYAEPSGIVDFVKVYPTATKLSLPVCSRSPSTVLDAAYRLIERNQTRKKKPPLVPLFETERRTKGGMVCSVKLKSAKEEAEFLANALCTLISVGVPVKEIMVLCANRQLGLKLLEDVRSKDSGLPLQDSLTRQEENAEVVEYLVRFICNHSDNMALRILLSRLIGLNSVKISKIRRLAMSGCSTLWDAIHVPQSIDIMKSAKKKTDIFLSTVSETEGLEKADALRRFAERYPEITENVENRIAKSTWSQEPSDIEQRISQRESINGIRFMTLHFSKGLVLCQSLYDG